MKKSNQMGGVAVEFILVFPILIWVILAGLELCFMLYSQTRLEHAMQHISRTSFDEQTQPDLNLILAHLREKIHKDIALDRKENMLRSSYVWQAMTPFLSDLMHDYKIQSEVALFKESSS